jgi:hypothetical protein
MSKIKAGDVVVCRPEHTNAEGSGGAGYESGRIFKVSKFNSGRIAWPIDDDGNSAKGVHGHALRLANEYELAWYEKKKNKGFKNISGMYDEGIKKLSVHYINKNGEKTKADVDRLSDIKDMQEFLYKFER